MSMRSAVHRLVGSSSPQSDDKGERRLNRFHDIWRRRASRVKQMFQSRMNVYKLRQFQAEAKAEKQIERAKNEEEKRMRAVRVKVMQAFKKQREETRSGIIHGTTSAKQTAKADEPTAAVTLSEQRLMRRFRSRQERVSRRLEEEKMANDEQAARRAKRQHDKAKKLFRQKWRQGRNWEEEIMKGFAEYDAKKEKVRESVQRHIVKERQVQERRKIDAHQSKIVEAFESLDQFDRDNDLLGPQSSDEDNLDETGVSKHPRRRPRTATQAAAWVGSASAGSDIDEVAASSLAWGTRS